MSATKKAPRQHPGDIEQFEQEVEANIRSMGKDGKVRQAAFDFMRDVAKYKYSYNFTWMGLPIIQAPQDIVAMQELIWKVRPDTIIETGIARGGSVIFYAAMMEMMGISDGRVIGVDIDIRPHNRESVETHPMGRRVTLIQGSSIAPATIERVKAAAKGGKNVMVCLDSMHTHAHVLEELRLYSPLVTKGSYLVAFDTVIENMPADFYPDRPWSVGDNPHTAVQEFLKETADFEVDHAVSDKLLITVAPGGYLRRKK